MKSSYVCNIEIRCFRCDPLSWIYSNRLFSTCWAPTASSRYTWIIPTLFSFVVKLVCCRYRHEHVTCYMCSLFCWEGRKVLCCLFMWRHEAYLIHKHEKINIHLISSHRDSWWDLLLTNRLPLTFCAPSRMLFKLELGFQYNVCHQPVCGVAMPTWVHHHM